MGMPMHLLTLLLRQQPRMPIVLLMQQRKLLPLLACLREVERNTCRGLATLWLLHLILLASTCRWMSRLLEGRGPLLSRLPRPTRQGRTSKTRLLVLKQQPRGLPLHLTMRNGLYSLTRNPRLRPLRSPSRCWTRRWPQSTPLPAEESATSSSTPRNTTTSANETQDQGSSSRLCPSSNRSPPRPSDPGGLAGDDEHGLLQRRRLARQPARGQGRGHRQGARHPPAGQEVDSGERPWEPSRLL